MKLIDEIKSFRERRYKINELTPELREAMESYLKQRFLRYRTVIIRVYSNIDAKAVGSLSHVGEFIVDETYVYSTMKFLMEEGFEVERRGEEIYVKLPKEIL